MSRYLFNHCARVIVIGFVIGTSIAVSVRPDKDELALEPMRPSPIDESQNDKSLIRLDESSIDRANASKTKREDSDDDKSDVKFGGNAERREKEIRKFPESFAGVNKFGHCCGSRFEVSAPVGRPESSQQFTTRAAESDRYPNRLGGRPDDRYGWQSSSARPTGGPLSGGSLYGGQGSRPDRYGWRPPYGSGQDGEYGRPPVGSRPPLNRPGYGYGDNGAYGTSGFESSRPGIHFSGGSRPPGSGYGIHGTIGEQDEFPGDAGADALPHPPSNIHTQKAVALKALAGVALIGAAAALAANPVLLPVGVLAGRKKRSIENNYDNLEFLYGFMRAHVPEIDRESTSDEFWNEPICIARLTCELQQHYLKTVKNEEALVMRAPILKQRLEAQMEQLLETEIISAKDVEQSLQLLTKIWPTISSAPDSCKTLNCRLYVP